MKERTKEKITSLQQIARAIISNWTSSKAYINDPQLQFAPRIQQEKLQNALQSYAPIKDEEEALVLIVDSRSGNADYGALLTDRRLYVHNRGEKPKSIGLFDIYDVDRLYGIFYLSNPLYINRKKFLTTAKCKKEVIWNFHTVLSRITEYLIAIPAEERERLHKKIKEEEEKEEKVRNEQQKKEENLSILHYDKTNLKKNELFGCLITILFITIIIIAIGGQLPEQHSNQSKVKPLGNFEQYINISNLKALKHNSDPYITSKILIVDKNSKKIDSLQPHLPIELRATKQEEIRTIIWIERSSAWVGCYSGTNLVTGEKTKYDALVALWKITIIDKTSLLITETKEFRGSAPPNTIYIGMRSDFDVYVKNKQGKLVNASDEDILILLPDFNFSNPNSNLRYKVVGPNPSKAVLNYIITLPRVQNRCKKLE